MRQPLFYLTLVIALVVGCGPNVGSSVRMSGSETNEAAFNMDGAPIVEFDVPDMMCPEGCGTKTKEILSGLPGAKEVVINFEAKTAIVAIEEDQFDPDAAVAALKDYGFENSALKSGDASKSDSNEVADEPAS